MILNYRLAFNAEDPAPEATTTRTMTTAEIEQIRQEAVEQSRQSAEAQAQTEELETLRKEKAEREEAEKLTLISSTLSSKKITEETGIKNVKSFSKEYSERLTGKNEEDTLNEIKKIRAEIEKNKDSEQLDMFFKNAANVNTTKLLKDKNGEEKKTTSIEDMFYPGTTIRRK